MSYDTHPSDLGDIKPVDPVISIESAQGEYISSKVPTLPGVDTFEPQLNSMPPKVVEREVFAGQINEQSWEGDRLYVSVSLQDGRSIRALVLGATENDVINDFDPCLVVRGNYDGEWFCMAQRFDKKNLKLYQVITAPTLDGADETRNWFCTGCELFYNSETQKWDSDNDKDPEQLEFPMWWCPDIGHGIVGARVWVWCNAGGKLFIITHAEGIWRFELKDDLTTGGSAQAYVIGPDGTSTETLITVYDLLSKWNGKGRVVAGSLTTDGSKGYCKYFTDSLKFEILEVQRIANLIRGTGPSGTVAVNASYTLSNPVSLDGGILPGDTVTVTNYSTALPTDAADVTVVSDGAGGYRTLDGPCP